MTDRALLQQALEALVLSTPEPRENDDDYCETGWKEHRAAIRALRERLAQQPAPMSEPNRVIAYAASSKLHDLGYRWLDGEWVQPAPQPDTKANSAETAKQISEPVTNASEWWTLVMGASASIEDALNCMRDEDAKRQALGAMKHYREKANALSTPPRSRASGRG